MRCHQFLEPTTRREMLRNSGCGIGKVALAAMLGNAIRTPTAAAEEAFSQIPHIKPRAKRVIFLFMWGGPSHVDLFDPKPRLNTEAGKPLAGKSVGSDRDQLGTVLGSPYQFAQHGESGV